ncbi:MAG: 50S ribosomal protein L28 [Clostridia bacterium]|nr:50S ribosomal protein L28 [Clostridia bacterium]
MAKCEICGKGVSFGLKVSHSNRKTNRMWKPNIRTVRADVNGTGKTMHICSRCLHAQKRRAARTV